MSEEKEEKSKKLETYTGLLLAVFAAVLAITDLGGGKYGDDEMIAIHKASSTHAWYQSKSVKQTLKESNTELLTNLLKEGVISDDKRAGVESYVAAAKEEIERYKKEKTEILKGSAVVGKENWAQDIKGELGLIKGAEEWEKESEVLGEAGDFFDRATLFLQLCLVLGAISLISGTDSSKRNFFIGMIAFGIIGSIISSYAFYIASLV